jgi:hypothetical protein
MERMQGIAQARALMILLVLGILATAGTPRPSLAQGDDESWAPVTVVYTSDIKGHIEPCG